MPERIQILADLASEEKSFGFEDDRMGFVHGQSSAFKSKVDWLKSSDLP